MEKQKNKSRGRQIEVLSSILPWRELQFEIEADAKVFALAQYYMNNQRELRINKLN